MPSQRFGASDSRSVVWLGSSKRRRPNWMLDPIQECVDRCGGHLANRKPGNIDFQGMYLQKGVSTTPTTRPKQKRVVALQGFAFRTEHVLFRLPQGLLEYNEAASLVRSVGRVRRTCLLHFRRVWGASPHTKRVSRWRASRLQGRSCPHFSTGQQKPVLRVMLPVWNHRLVRCVWLGLNVLEPIWA